jgi:hypothetical protein
VVVLVVVAAEAIIVIKIVITVLKLQAFSGFSFKNLHPTRSIKISNIFSN